MLFVFVTVISIITSETQGKLTEYQHHKKKNNQKSYYILWTSLYLIVDLDMEKQHGKVIQRNEEQEEK